MKKTILVSAVTSALVVGAFFLGSTLNSGKHHHSGGHHHKHQHQHQQHHKFDGPRDRMSPSILMNCGKMGPPPMPNQMQGDFQPRPPMKDHGKRCHGKMKKDRQQAEAKALLQQEPVSEEIAVVTPVVNEKA
jgi:hypothetical protein